MLYVRNGQGLVWTVSYNVDGKMTRISNQFGRWIEMSRSTVNGDVVISSITANDGRVVTYNYGVFNSKTVLTSATYPGGVIAQYTYTYGDSPSSGRPVLLTADDPMGGGPGARTRYAYAYGTTPTGSVKEGRNLATNQLIINLPFGSGSYPQILEGNGVEIARKFSNALLSEEWDGLISGVVSRLQEKA